MPVIDIRAEIAIQTIVLATDFSTSSERAAVYAKALAHRFGSTVQVTHVIDLSVLANSESALVGLSADELRRESDAKLKMLLRQFSGTRTRTKELDAFALPEAILRSAKDCGAGLVILGTTSKHGLQKLVAGSTAEAVIRAST